MKTREPTQRQRRHVDRALQNVRKDPYRAAGKSAGPAVCPGCGALYQRGKWSWGTTPAVAERLECPACQRIEQNQPAGYLKLSGAFFTANRDAVLQLVRNEEAREKSVHPLQRVMAIRKQRDTTMVTTTDIHIARRLGDALRHAFQGDLEMKYSPEEPLVRLSWAR